MIPSKHGRRRCCGCRGEGSSRAMLTTARPSCCYIYGCGRPLARTQTNAAERRRRGCCMCSGCNASGWRHGGCRSSVRCRVSSARGRRRRSASCASLRDVVQLAAGRRRRQSTWPGERTAVAGDAGRAVHREPVSTGEQRRRGRARAADAGSS